METKRFIDEFATSFEQNLPKEIDDYDEFPNKELLDELRNKIIQNLIDNKDKTKENMKDFVKDEIDKSVEGYDLTNEERSYIYNLIDNEVNGYGPLTELLKDKEITEIMVNSPNEIYIELDGKVIKDDSVSFINDDHIVRVVQRLIQPIGKTIDIAHPMVDARLEDGSRLNAILPPLSLNGPVVTIRKFKSELANVEDLLRTGTLTPYMARFLEACVHAKLNILVVGGTGAGKTTLLNVLSSFCDPHDRIIVGEVRGKEAFDMLQAMNTGHEGSMTTMHANGPSDALNRLETMVLMNGVEIPVTAIREYIESAIQIVVQVQRLSDGRRRVSSINEIIGIENGEIKQKEIFKFRQTGVLENGDVDGEFLLHRYVPKVYNRIKAQGIDNLKDIFGE